MRMASIFGIALAAAAAVTAAENFWDARTPDTWSRTTNARQPRWLWNLALIISSAWKPPSETDGSAGQRDCSSRPPKNALRMDGRHSRWPIWRAAWQAVRRKRSVRQGLHKGSASDSPFRRSKPSPCNSRAMPWSPWVASTTVWPSSTSPPWPQSAQSSTR